MSKTTLEIQHDLERLASDPADAIWLIEIYLHTRFSFFLDLISIYWSNSFIYIWGLEHKRLFKYIIPLTVSDCLIRSSTLLVNKWFIKISDFSWILSPYLTSYPKPHKFHRRLLRRHLEYAIFCHSFFSKLDFLSGRMVSKHLQVKI